MKGEVVIINHVRGHVTLKVDKTDMKELRLYDEFTRTNKVLG